jgi:type III secretory pathway component EscS
MYESNVYEVMSAALRAVLLISLPTLLAVSLIGSVVAAFQAATSIREEAISFICRLGALGMVVYLFHAAFAEVILDLGRLAFQ